MRRSEAVPSPEPPRLAASNVNELGSKGWLLLLALVVAVFLAYQPAWQGGMLWDDEAHVTRSHLRSWDGLRRIWFELGATQQYYPLLHSLFWLQWHLWGDAPLGYHLVNIALHATAAVLVVLVLRRLKVPGALLAAAIFALHPIEVESVAWITEQKNTLSAVFYLAAALAYLRFDESRSKLSYTVALGLFVLGLYSKTVITATLPAALLVVFWWQRGWLPWRKGLLPWRRDVLPLVPFFLLGVGGGLLTACVERKVIGAEGAEYAFTVLERLLIAGRVIWFYLGKLCWPADLIFIYPRWNVSQAVWWQYLFPLAALLLVAVLWFLALWRRWRAPLAGMLFFIGTLFPVLGFYDVYPFRYSLVADHFQYMAGLGIITLAAAGLSLLSSWGLSQFSPPDHAAHGARLRRVPGSARCPKSDGPLPMTGAVFRPIVAGWQRSVSSVLCLVLLAVLATLTWRQSRMYADAETLYRMTIDRNPACWMAHHNLGAILFEQERFDEVIAHYQEAIRIKPDYAEAHYNIGIALDQQGKHLEAIAAWREAARLQPTMIASIDQTAWLQATCPVASVRNGAEAVMSAERLVALSGGKEPVLLDTLAAAYAEVERFADAVTTAQKAVQLAESTGQTPLADRIRARLELYRACQPYRETSSSRAAPVDGD